MSRVKLSKYKILLLKKIARKVSILHISKLTLKKGKCVQLITQYWNLPRHKFNGIFDCIFVFDFNDLWKCSHS